VTLVRFLAVSLAAAACAAAPLPAATKPVDWPGVAAERVPVIVTTDEDGGERATKIWLVVVDGEGLIRTGNTRWFRNIERDPNVELEIGRVRQPLRAVLVEDDALRARANAAFRDKYGFQDRMVHPFGATDAHILRLVLRR
jgi:hypothetical protein